MRHTVCHRRTGIEFGVLTELWNKPAEYNQSDKVNSIETLKTWSFNP